MGRLISIIAISLGSLVFYLPAILGKIELFNRNNDLDGFFWPNFLFVKKQILENGSVPFWNTQIFGGTPLLPDPQAPFFYLPNVFFLFMPIDNAFLIAFILHSILGGIGIYLCSRQILKISKLSSVFTSFLYIFAPRLAGYLEAGHVGLIYSYAWLPFVFLSTVKIAQTKNIVWSFLLSLSLAAIFFTHATTFVFTAGMSAVVFIATIWIRKNLLPKPLLIYLLGFVLTFGITAIALLPQLEWVPSSTRIILKNAPDVYPKWNSPQEFLSVVLVPIIGGFRNIWNIDTEKWITLGILPSLLAFYGFTNLRRKLKAAVAVALFFVLLISLNNISPIYNILLSQDWFVYMRVSTRIWFVTVFATTILAGIGFEKISKRIGNHLAMLVLIFALSELLFLSWAKVQKPPNQRDFLSKDAYKIFQEDPQKHRVFCLDRCIPLVDSVEYNIELLEGYNTLQQMNFFKHSWQLMGSYWNYYTLAIPPIGYTKFDKLKPDPKSLGEYNVKYVVSPSPLENSNLELNSTFGQYYIYRNKLFLPRAYFLNENQSFESEAQIVKYNPGFIKIDTSKNASEKLVFSTVFNKGWKAYLNGEKEAEVLETPNALQLVNIPNDTKYVDLNYLPGSYKIGRVITIATLFIISLTISIKRILRRKTG